MTFQQLSARKAASLLLKESEAGTDCVQHFWPLQLTRLGVGAIVGAGIFGWSHYFSHFVGLLGVKAAGGSDKRPPALVITALLTTVLVAGIPISAAFNASSTLVRSTEPNFTLISTRSSHSQRSR
jgi:hypothetical protein